MALTFSKHPELLEEDGLKEKPHVIRIEYLFQIMKEWDAELDLDELECILAN